MAIGRVMRDLLLRLVLRFFLSERSMAWLYNHRVEWDRELPAGAPTSAQVAGAKPGSVRVILRRMGRSLVAGLTG
jgi:hypothetical protein